jgi:hypothetical protein
MWIAYVDVDGTDGLGINNTVAGGYGSRLRPCSGVTALVGSRRHRLRIVQLGCVPCGRPAHADRPQRRRAVAC